MKNLQVEIAFADELEKIGFKLQGHLSVQGLPIAVENHKGSVRKGVDKDGKSWRTEMKHPYGYIQGTKGADGEEVDAYVGPNKKAPTAFVVHQRKEDGKGFDEDKVMLGFGTQAAAEKAFLVHYDSPKFLGPVSAVPMERLKELVEAKGPLKKISSAEGLYHGKKTSPDSVKKIVDFQGMKVKIDRPKGFVLLGKDEQGKLWRRAYKLDYGFIPKTEGGDGEGADVFLGPDAGAQTSFWAIQKKKDGSFDEYKIMLGFQTRAAAKKAYTDHIPSRFLGGLVAVPVNMMKALLGQMPFEKLAARLAFFDELERIGNAVSGVD